MRRYLGAAALGAVLLAATPGLACSRVEYSRAWTVGEDVAVNLVRNAATVELVIAESARVLGGEYPALLDEASKSIEVVGGRSQPAEITYRVLERLKGSGPTEFMLKGAVLTSPSGPAVRAPKFHAGDYSDPRAVYEAEALRTLDEPNDCRLVLPAVVGARYLVFRSADGALLGATVPYRWRGKHAGEVVGPVYEAISGDNDPWLRRVRSTVARLNGARR